MMTASVTKLREKRLSVRLIWPFLRVTKSIPAAARLMQQEGLGSCDLARSDTRLRHQFVMDLLNATVQHTGDPTIGLRAGECSEPGDLDVLEQAARACTNLREALRCSARYVQLLNEAACISLEEHPGHTLWRYWVTDGVPQPRAANDFVLVCAARFVRRYADVNRPPLEVHFAHAAPIDTGAYEKIFRSKLKFGMPHNGFVIDSAQLERPMRRASPRMRAAFESYARELLERLTLGTRGRARELVTEQLRTGEMCMESVAASLAMSVPTLRRRLEEEGTTFTELVDDVRRDLADRYLRDPQRSIGEIAFLLGFAHAPAFHKAFRRWTGLTPSEHRARIMWA
jgi:AraC-like DNA-binding protein